MKFSIYQAQISREAISRINAVGWDGDFGEYEMEVRIQRDVKFFGGSKGYVSEMSEYYDIVAYCKATDLDDVVWIGNSYGDQSKIQRVAERMHSVSVGDIIECHDTGDCFMVDPKGFTKVDFLEVA